MKKSSVARGIVGLRRSGIRGRVLRPFAAAMLVLQDRDTDRRLAVSSADGRIYGWYHRRKAVAHFPPAPFHWRGMGKPEAFEKPLGFEPLS